MRKLKVTYMDGHKVPDDEGIIDEINYKSVMVDRNYTKLYPAAVFKLAKLKGCPIILFLYLCERCTDDNLIHTGRQTIENFNLWLNRATSGEEQYSEIAVKKSFKDLKDIQLILPEGKGWARLNPVYFWKGELEQGRADLIRKLIEENKLE